MEPFETDELSDRELDGLLHTWQVPDAPPHLRQAIFSQPCRASWWALWGASIRVPVPVARFVAIALALTIWNWPRHVIIRQSPPAVEVRTVRVEVPVATPAVKRVTRDAYRDVYRDPGELRPVAQLQPRIIRTQNADN